MKKIHILVILLLALPAIHAAAQEPQGDTLATAARRVLPVAPQRDLSVPAVFAEPFRGTGAAAVAPATRAPYHLYALDHITLLGYMLGGIEIPAWTVRFDLSGSRIPPLPNPNSHLFTDNDPRASRSGHTL